MNSIKIYFKDQNEESEKIKSITDMIETIYEIRMTKASYGMIGCGFEFPVVEINSRLYSYTDGLKILKESLDV